MNALPIRQLADALMEARGLTHSQIAQKVGISEPQVRNILSGRTRRPNVITAGRIARVLGVSIDRLWPPEAA